MGFKRFDKDFRSSAFQESNSIIFVNSFIWESVRFYFKKTKSIRIVDFVSSDDFNGYQTESYRKFLETSRYNLILK